MKIHCYISKLSPKDSVKVSLECLEQKGKDVDYYLYIDYFDIYKESESTYYSKESVTLLTRKEIEGAEKFSILLYPYGTGQIHTKIEGTKLTYILRIYEDNKLYLERTLNFPQESSRSFLDLSL